MKLIWVYAYFLGAFFLIFNKNDYLFSAYNILIMAENQQDMAENRIKAVLADKNHTCKWLAQELGLSENTVSRWCSNRFQPSLAQLGKVASALDVDIRELIKPTK